MARNRSAFVLALALLAAPASAATVAGAARVVDGDTLRIGATAIRLFGIDAPEAGQGCERQGQGWACGTWATEALRKMLKGRDVSCEGAEHDRYGRLLATCRVGGADVNAMLVRQGAALAYRRYSSRYAAEELAARAERIGVWAGEVRAPEAFRHRKRTSSRQGPRPQ